MPVIECGLLFAVVVVVVEPVPVIVLRAVAGGLGAGDMFSKVHPYCLHPYFHFLLSGCLGHPPDQTF